MKQANLPVRGSALLECALARLSPEVFSHPVWVRFGITKVSSSLGIVDDLLSAAKNIQADDPSAACQVLLICAVYQNYAGQRHHALKMIKQALALAEQSGLSRETIWAIWGACAVSIQQGNYEQAVQHFVELQAALSEQNEWILADFVDVVRQALFQTGIGSLEKHSGSTQDRLFGNVLTFTFDWLQHWGDSAAPSASGLAVVSKQPRNHPARSLFSFQRWQDRWNSLILAFRGELELQWAENESEPTTRRFSFWGAILSSLRLYLSGRKIDTEVTDNDPRIPKTTMLLPEKEESPLRPVARKKKPVATPERENSPHGQGQAATALPMTVQMLGSFSLMIGDLAVKLPASRGLSLLKYVLLHHRQKTPREVLMDAFWPDAEPETARNNLNVAMYSLRKALRRVIYLPVIVFEDGAYGLEPNLEVWLDVEEFERTVKSGRHLEARDQLTAAVNEYEAAISLYQGDFLEENPYEGWTVLTRESLRMAYLTTLDSLSQIYFNQQRYAACIRACQLILTRDCCREDAHCMLMRCFSHQGQDHLALRQYHACAETLRLELDVAPAPNTTQLFQQIRQHRRV